MGYLLILAIPSEFSKAQMDIKKLELPGVTIRRNQKIRGVAVYGISRKKDFRQRVIEAVPGMTPHKANMQYDGYRAATSKALSHAIAQALLDGSLTVESVSTFDGQVRLVRMHRKVYCQRIVR